MMILSEGELQSADFQAGVTLLVDKPLHWTSFDVVNKLRFLIRRKLDVKKIKVGHAGTLDPLASGLLIIAIGKDTRQITEYQGMEKIYTGTLRLGATTSTYDSEFPPDASFPIDHITPEHIEKARLNYIGEIRQIPPAFSAIKVDGKRAYDLARKGRTVELKERIQHIHFFHIDPSGFPELSFEVGCDSGTYIRTLAFDFGRSLDSGAYLTSLRRTGIGPYRVEQAFNLDTLLHLLDEKAGR